MPNSTPEANIRKARNAAHRELTNFFHKKGYGIISHTNKLAHMLFSQALNSATNKTQFNSIVSKARNYRNSLYNLAHHVKNQGPGYGRPINVLYAPPANANNRKNIVRNYEAFKASGNLNANLRILLNLSKRLNSLKKYERNIGYARYR